MPQENANKLSKKERSGKGGDEATSSLNQKISFFIITILVFFLPLFVLPIPAFSLSAVKSFLVWISVFASFLFLVFHWVGNESVKIPRSRILFFSSLLFLVYFVSAFVAPGNSGYISATNPVSTAAFAAAAFFSLFIIPSVIVKGKQISKVLLTFLISSLIVFWANIIYLFNLVPSFAPSPEKLRFPLFLSGSPELGTVAAVAASFSLVFLTSLSLNALFRGFLYFTFLSSLAIVVAVNEPGSLIFLALISLIVVVYVLFAPGFAGACLGVRKKKKTALKRARKYAPALFLSLLALAFAGLSYSGGFYKNNVAPYLNTPESISGEQDLLPSRASAISLERTIKVAKNTYKNGVFMEMFFGSGPGTFSQQLGNYTSLKTAGDPLINKGSNSPPSSGVIPTAFVTTGFFGGALWALLLGALLIAILRFIFTVRYNKAGRFANPNSRFEFITLAAATYILLASVFYPLGFTVMILAFVFAALYLSSYSLGVSRRGRAISIHLGNQPALGLGIIAITFVLLAVGGVGLFFAGQYYASVFEYKQARALHKEGDYKLAEEKINSAIEYANSDVYRRLAAALHMEEINKMNDNEIEEKTSKFQKAWEEAVRDAQVSTEIDPDDYRNWQTLGDLYASVAIFGVRGATEKARDAYSRALELNSSNKKLYFSLAKMEAKLGNFGKAVSQIKELLKEHPNETRALYLLSKFELERGNTGNARNALEKIVKKNPDNVSAYFRLGMLHFREQEYEKAMKKFNKTLKLNPRHVSALYLSGLVYAIKGERGKAIEQMQKLKKTKPGNKHIQKVLANLKAGKPALAGVGAAGGKSEAPISGGRIKTSF